MKSFGRRNFLKQSGLGLLPAIVPFKPFAEAEANKNRWSPPATPIIKFYGDGEMFEPGDYLNELQKAHANSDITRDVYGAGGVVDVLEKRFAEITGKQKAIY